MYLINTSNKNSQTSNDVSLINDKSLVLLDGFDEDNDFFLCICIF